MPTIDSVNTVTIWTLVGILVVAAIIDVALSLYGPPGSSISNTVWALGQRYPIVPFLIGLLVGHLLWPQKG